MDAQPQKIISQIGEINERLKSLRKSLKIKQKDFSFNLGLNQSYYSDVENGKKSVTSRIIQALREKYNISSEWMYTGKEPINISNDDMECTPGNVHPMYTLEESAISDEVSEEDIKKYWQDYKEKIKQAKPQGKGSELIENQLRIANDVISSMPYMNESFKKFKEDFEVLRKFQYSYADFFESEVIKQMLEPFELAAKYPTASYFDLEKLLSADFERFKPFANLIATLVSAIKTFVEEAKHFSKEKTGIEPEDWNLHYHIYNVNA